MKGYRVKLRRTSPVFGDMNIADFGSNHIFAYIRKCNTVIGNRDSALMSVAFA